MAGAMDDGDGGPAGAGPTAADFRHLADAIPQLAWIADGEGSIFWYNRRWYDYTGTTLDEMRGRGWAKVHHPDHVLHVVERYNAAFSRGDTWEDTFPLRRHDGAYRWFLSRAEPLRDEVREGVCPHSAVCTAKAVSTSDVTSPSRRTFRAGDEPLLVEAHAQHAVVVVTDLLYELVLREVPHDDLLVAPAACEQLPVHAQAQHAAIVHVVDDARHCPSGQVPFAY